MVIQEYQDPKVGKYLRYGFWYMEHKGVIDRTVRLVLVFIVVGIWSLALFQFYNYTQESADVDAMARNLVATIVPVNELHRAREPQAPVVSEAYVLVGRDALTADFLSWVENPNPLWYLEVDYSFNWSGGQTLERQAFVLPQSKTALIENGVTVNSLPAGAEVAVTPKKWVRLKDKDILQRLDDFQKKIALTPNLVERQSDVTAATFTVNNNTIYDLLTPRFSVVLFQAGSPVAAAVNEVEYLSSGEAKLLEQRWLQPLPNNLEARVWPQINFYQSGNYRLPKGGETKF